MENKERRVDRYIGSLVGLAVGDALGAPVSFKAPGSFTPIQDMVSGGVYNLQLGQWTDDTSMALCLAESLLSGGFNAIDQMNRYIRWYKEGYLSSTGMCFDIGNATRAALDLYIQTGKPYSGSKSKRIAGNGSLMRLAPVALYYAGDPKSVMLYCQKSSQTTHGTAACIDACKLLGALISGAVRKHSKERLLSPYYHPLDGYWDNHPLMPAIAAIAAGSYKVKQPPEIEGSGYVVKSLEAALWAFYNSNSFAEGALMAVNLGDDADTTGAVYGQLAGAFYGIQGIPAGWREKVSQYDLLEKMAIDLYNTGPSIQYEAVEASGRVLFETERRSGGKIFRIFLTVPENPYGTAFAFAVFNEEWQPLKDEWVMLRNYYSLIKSKVSSIRFRYPELESELAEIERIVAYQHSQRKSRITQH